MAEGRKTAGDTSGAASYYDRIAAKHALPLWVDTRRFVPWEPAPPYVPALWKYDDLRPLLIEAGTLISAEEASRRVLVLQNPALSGFEGTTRSLYACLQLILPGERASEHRHTQAALRLILEGGGAYTTVDGEKLWMAPGDFIITPSWRWHGHAHDGDGPMVWLDGLDNGLMAQLDTTFFEPGREAPEVPASSAAGDAPPLRFPYAESRAALEEMRRAAAPDPCHGYRRDYVDPATGAAAIPTMTTSLTLLAAGFSGMPYRATEGAVHVVIEGEGETVVAGETLAWGPRDVFVVPSWAEHRHLATSDAVLFSFSDRTVQQKLGVWREARGA